MFQAFVLEYLEYILGLGAIAIFILFVRVAKGSGRKKAIMLACQYGDTNEVRSLLQEVGYLATVWDSHGFTPLHVASLWGFEDIVLLLLKYKANVSARNQAGQTPLHGASMAGHEDVVRILLDRGADVNAKDNLGNTPLYFAAWDGQAAVTRLLLERGADLSVITDKGESALDRARLRGHDELVSLLTAEMNQRGLDTPPPDPFPEALPSMAEASSA